MIAKPISALELHYPMIQFLIIAELSRARRASGAPWVRKWSNLPIRGNLVIRWPYTDRPTDRPPKRPSVCTTGMPMFTLTLCSYFGSPLIAYQCCDQLTAVKTRHPLTSITVSRAQVSTHPGWVFFEVFRWQVTSFQMTAGSFFLFIWNMLCLCHYGPALLKFWFQTDLGRENSASYLKMQVRKTDALKYSKCRAYQTLFKITHRYKTVNKKETQ